MTQQQAPSKSRDAIHQSHVIAGKIQQAKALKNTAPVQLRKQPEQVYTKSDRAVMMNTGLSDASSHVDEGLNSIDLYETEVRKQDGLSPACQDGIIAKEASRKLEGLSKSVLATYIKGDADLVGKSTAQVNKAMQSAGAMDIIILQNAAMLISQQDMNIQQIISTGDPDLVRASYILPLVRHTVLKNDPKNIGRMHEETARHTLGAEGYADMQAANKRITTLNALSANLLRHSVIQKGIADNAPKIGASNVAE